MLVGRIRFALVAAVLCAALLPVTALAAEVESATGSVEVGRGDPPQWHKAAAGEKLVGGEVVRTGVDGRAELRIDGTTVRLYPGSLLRIPAERASNGAPRLQLEKGQSLFDVLRGQRGLEVETSEVVVSVKGTRFAVDANAQRVSVFRGTVGVRKLGAPSKEEILVREGFVLTLTEEGTLDLQMHSHDDPWPSWTDAGAFPASPMHSTLSGTRKGMIQAATGAARALAKPKAVQYVLAQNPELERRVAEAIAAESEDIAQRDSVADVAELQTPLLQAYAQTIASGGAGGGGGGGSAALVVTLIEAVGPLGIELVLVEDPATTLALTFDQLTLQAIAGGSSMFPAAIVSILGNQGVTEQAFAQALLVVMNN